MWRKVLLLVLINIVFNCFIYAHAASVDESIKAIASSGDFIEIKEMDGMAIDLRYATSNNFLGKNIYGSFDKVFLHKIAAEKLMRAVKLLKAKYPEYKLVIFDALRPRSIQFLLWARVKGTEQEKYVANPKGGSIHNYGFAVDLTVLDGQGKELDMGTPYDDFSSLAQPALEADFLKKGKLNQSQIHNRQILRSIMAEAGFIQLPLEWWHFDALPKKEVKATYKIID